MSEPRFIDRELSWLEFNNRVLEEALDMRNPLLERVQFFQIFSSNLDEFFMKRVGGLKRQVLAKVSSQENWETSPEEKLATIRLKLQPMLERYATHFTNHLIRELRENQIHLLRYQDLNPDELKYVQTYFEQTVFPVLTPLAFDPGHPFPFLSNLSTSFGILVRHPGRPMEELFVRVKVPPIFPTWIHLPQIPGQNETRFVSLYEVMGQNLASLFPGMEVVDVMMFRVARNADIESDAEDAEDLLEMVAEELKERRFADVVRIEHGPQRNEKIINLLKEQLEVTDQDIYALPLWLEYYSLHPIIELPRSDLKFKVWVPVIPKPFTDPESNPFDTIRQNDILVHHPYESFSASIERVLRAATKDPKVLAIKMTLYRTGKDSPFIPLLIQAAESGKQVACLVELKARFDEEKNIVAAQALEDAGVHVVYGIMGLKTHCKIALIIRQEPDGVRSYVHIGTGNYHVGTARLYTDFGLLTSNPQYTSDVVHLFHYLTGRSLEWNFQKLLVAPIDMRESFLRMIEREVNLTKNNSPGRIIVKLNSLQDPTMIRALYDASQKGVKIDLIVRGICCLLPGVKGLSENIRVFSILGRFLEHSRVFYFQNGKADPLEGEFFIGSADWMTRNLQARVEVVTPIESTQGKHKIWNTLEIMLQDSRQGWELQNDGQYTRRGAPEIPNELGSHHQLMELTKREQ